MKKELESLFESLLSENQITLEEGAFEKLLTYLDLLSRWNKVHNLTAIRDPKEMVSKHLIDSLVIAPYVTSINLLDVGTGGGLPGIPLAIALPHLQVTLLDSNGKKCTFLRQTVNKLGLQNVQVACTRVESYSTEKPFEMITSRAFASLYDFVTQSAHLLSPNGAFLAMKGNYPHDELAALPDQYIIDFINALTIKGLSGERHLIGIRRKKHE